MQRMYQFQQERLRNTLTKIRRRRKIWNEMHSYYWYYSQEEIKQYNNNQKYCFFSLEQTRNKESIFDSEKNKNSGSEKNVKKKQIISYTTNDRCDCTRSAYSFHTCIVFFVRINWKRDRLVQRKKKTHKIITTHLFI